MMEAHPIPSHPSSRPVPPIHPTLLPSGFLSKSGKIPGTAGPARPAVTAAAPRGAALGTPWTLGRQARAAGRLRRLLRCVLRACVRACGSSRNFGVCPVHERWNQPSPASKQASWRPARARVRRMCSLRLEQQPRSKLCVVANNLCGGFCSAAGRARPKLSKSPPLHHHHHHHPAPPPCPAGQARRRRRPRHVRCRRRAGGRRRPPLQRGRRCRRRRRRWVAALQARPH